MFDSKGLRARADEIDVRAEIHDQSSRVDGIAQPLHAGNAAGTQRGAIHEQCVQLHSTIVGEETAAAGVEGFVVFHHSDSGLDRIDRGRTFFQQRVACGEGVGYALAVRLDEIIRNVPCAAMEGEDGCNFEAHAVYCSGGNGG